MIAFDSRFPEQYQLRLEELEEEEGQWGWIESSKMMFGNKVRYYGKLPKREKKQKSNLNVSGNNSASIGGSALDSAVISGNNNVVHQTVINVVQPSKNRKTKKQQ
jgi:hypothetical protein